MYSAGQAYNVIPSPSLTTTTSLLVQFQSFVGIEYLRLHMDVCLGRQMNDAISIIVESIPNVIVNLFAQWWCQQQCSSAWLV